MNCSAQLRQPLRTAAALAAAAAFIASHIASVLRQADGALALAVIQAAATGTLLAVTLPTRRWLGLLVTLALLLALALGARHSPAAALLASAGVAHALLYAALLLVFAKTLRPGQTALISTLASRINPHFHPGMIPYTRAVTWAWVFAFAAELILSALLLATDPPLWSLFVNALHIPFILAVALIELAIRKYRWRHENPTGLLDTIRGTRRLWAQRTANSATTR